MYRSRGSSSLRIVRTASTTMSVNWSARSWYSFVRRDVRATHSRISLSVASILSLKVSRNCNVAFLAVSKPCEHKPTSDEKLCCSESRIALTYSKHLQGFQLTSTITRGCSPSPRYRSACFISSPMNSTVDVVPSLHSD